MIIPIPAQSLNSTEPNIVKSYLNELDLQTGTWHIVYDDRYYCCSDYKRLGTGFQLNSIAYYVYGTKNKADILQLVLNVNEMNESTLAHDELVNASKLLVKKSVGITLPDSFIKALYNGKNMFLTEKNYSITLKRETGPTNKYSLTFTIQGQINSLPIEHHSEKNNLVDTLIRKYGETDLVDIADAAARNNAWVDVITAIENMPPDSPKMTKGNLLLTLAYVEQGKATKASQVLESFTSDDAFYVLLEGRIAFIQGRDKRALDKFDQVLTRQSNFRNTQLVRNDALYYTAITYDNRYNATLSPESRQQAIKALNTLKNVYISQPDNPRFKLAKQKLASF